MQSLQNLSGWQPTAGSVFLELSVTNPAQTFASKSRTLLSFFPSFFFFLR